MVTEQMLADAMRKAVAVGIFPAWADTDTNIKHYEQLRQVLEAAQLSMQTDFAEACAYDEPCKQCIHPICENFKRQNR